MNPANKRHLDIIVVGTGLAGASAASSLGEMGFNVYNFCIQDSPAVRTQSQHRAVSMQQRTTRMTVTPYTAFSMTQSRAATSVHVKPTFTALQRYRTTSSTSVHSRVFLFAREYGGLLANRSFGGARVSRTFYAKGQTGQQLLLGAYSSLNRQINKGTVRSFNRREMLDIVIVDGRARGVIMRNLVTGEIERYAAHAVVLATGGYGRAFFLSTNAMGCNGSAAIQAFKKGAYLANLAFTQIHPPVSRYTVKTSRN